MKKIFWLLPVLAVTFSVQAQSIDVETQTLLNNLEAWVEDTVPLKAPSPSVSKNYRFGSRWSQRQATYRSLSGNQKKSTTSTTYNWAKKRPKRTAKAATPLRPKRTMSRSAFGAPSAKARLTNSVQKKRGVLKPQRFKARKTTTSTPKNLNLEAILNGLEADFDIEIGQ